MQEKVKFVITTLRDPAQIVSSQFGMRDIWDRVFLTVYNDTLDMKQLAIDDWVERAWWRHNLQVKNLATGTRLIWAQPSLPALPTKEESISENNLKDQSEWLRTAVRRLEEMQAFAIFHRLEESFELYSFRFCVPGEVQRRPHKKPRKVSNNLQSIVNQHFYLDHLLMKEAARIFDNRIARMRHLKAQGWLCDLSPLFEAVEANQTGSSTAGIVCL